MHLNSTNTVEVRDLSFCGNSAAEGGAVYALDTSGGLGLDTWQNLVFQDNAATERGGAVFLSGGHDVEMTNNTFVGNDAALYGGALYASDAYVDFVNNAVAYTVAGGAVYAADASSDSNSSFSYNDWYSNGGGDAAGSYSFSTSASGNITAQPLFTSYSQDGDCGNDRLWPQVGSLLIDAGDPSILDGSTSDIGAYGGPDADVSDEDGDGYLFTLDCDDADPSANPEAAEVWYDGVDQDCDGDDGAEDEDTGEAGGKDGGCSTAGGGSRALSLLGLLGLVAVTRRRRSKETLRT